MRPTLLRLVVSVLLGIALGNGEGAEDIPFRNTRVYPVPPTISADQAREIERKAAMGDPEGQLYLGALHANGHYGEIRFDVAREWYEHAAAQGNAKAMRNLAVLLQHGVGGERNERRALGLYIDAMNRGDAAALLGISSFYFANKITLVGEVLKWPHGRNAPLPMNMGGFRAWRYRALIAQGVPDGLKYGEDVFWRDYCKGDLVHQDENNILEYLLPAAVNDNSHEAQFSLAQLYLGIIEATHRWIADDPVPGVPERTPPISLGNPVINRAVNFWLQRAADNGNEYACSILTEYPVHLFEVDSEVRSRRLSFLKESAEEYFRFLYVLEQDRSASAFAALANEGNRYALFWNEKTRLENLDEVYFYHRLDSREEEELVAHPDPYARILHLDRILTLNCGDFPVFERLLFSILDGDDVQQHLFLYQTVILPRVEFAFYPRENTKNLKKDFPKEEVTKNLSILIKLLDESRCSNTLLKRLLRMRIQHYHGPLKPVIDLLLGQEGFPSKKSHLSPTLDDECDDLLSKFIAIQSSTDGPARIKVASDKIITRIVAEPEWNLLYMHSLQGSYTQSIESFLFGILLRKTTFY